MTTHSESSAGQGLHNIHVFIDGPSIDVTLGQILDRAPTSSDRPNWRLLEPFIRREYGGGYYSASFATLAPGAPSFVTFLVGAGFHPLYGERGVPGRGCGDVIAEAIQELEAGDDESWTLVVATQQESLVRRLPQLASHLLGTGKIAVMGFTELLPEDPVLEQVIDFIDLEDDARLFRYRLPRDKAEDFEAPYDEASEGVFGSPRHGMEFEESEPSEVHGSLGQGLLDALSTTSAERRTAEPAGPQTPILETATPAEYRPCYLLIDGHNIDSVLGQILGEKPSPSTRPDWQRVFDFVRARSRDAGRELTAHFAHIAPGHAGFRRAIDIIGFKSVPVEPDPDLINRSVVEEFVVKTLRTRAVRGERGDGQLARDVFVVSHAPAVFEALQEIPDAGQIITVLGFPEFMPPDEYDRVERLDIEQDTNAFKQELPRNTGYNVDEFDPEELFT